MSQPHSALFRSDCHSQRPKELVRPFSGVALRGLAPPEREIASWQPLRSNSTRLQAPFLRFGNLQDGDFRQKALFGSRDLDIISRSRVWCLWKGDFPHWLELLCSDLYTQVSPRKNVIDSKIEPKGRRNLCLILTVEFGEDSNETPLTRGSGVQHRILWILL
jgi:hypothetical protein